MDMKAVDIIIVMVQCVEVVVEVFIALQILRFMNIVRITLQRG